MYLDGKLVYNGCEVSNFRQNSGFSVGSVYDPYVKQSDKWTRPFDGYMQDIRVVKNSYCILVISNHQKNYYQYVQ